MKCIFKPVKRRNFLKKGITGGAALTFLSLQGSFSFPKIHSDFYNNHRSEGAKPGNAGTSLRKR